MQIGTIEIGAYRFPEYDTLPDAGIDGELAGFDGKAYLWIHSGWRYLVGQGENR